MRPSLRVLVAEDTMLTREGIVRLLLDAGLNVVGQVADAPSLMREVADASPDVVVADIRMPPTQTDEGLTAAIAIRQEYPEVGVLVLSQYVEPSYALRLLKEQPAKVGYLLKERIFDPAVLCGRLAPHPRLRNRHRPDHRLAPSGPSTRKAPVGPAVPPRARSPGPRRRGAVQPGSRDPPTRHRTHGRGPHHPGIQQTRARR